MPLGGASYASSAQMALLKVVLGKGGGGSVFFSPLGDALRVEEARLQAGAGRRGAGGDHALGAGGGAAGGLPRAPGRGDALGEGPEAAAGARPALAGAGGGSGPQQEPPWDPGERTRPGGVGRGQPDLERRGASCSLAPFHSASRRPVRQLSWLPAPSE